MRRARPARARGAALASLLLACAGVLAAACGDGGGQAVTPPPTPAPVITIGLLDNRTVEVDRPAPDFLLTTLGGERLRLSDFRGKTVVLNFWATWCPPCRREMPDFQALWEERGPDGPDDLVILAVNLISQDARADVRAFVREFGVSFPVLFDTSGDAVSRRYGVRALPATFFIDRDGIVRTTALGSVFGHLLEVGVADADTAGGTYE